MDAELWRKPIALLGQGDGWQGGLPLALVPVILKDFEGRERALRDRNPNYLGMTWDAYGNSSRPFAKGSIAQVHGGEVNLIVAEDASPGRLLREAAGSIRVARPARQGIALADLPSGQPG